ncbi:MAG: YggT family protein [bacterium]
MPALQNTFGALFETVAGLYLMVAILRLLFQSLRIDFHNPLVQIVVSITDPLLRPLRRIVPRLHRIDFAAAALIWLVALVKLIVPLLLGGYNFNWIGALIYSFADSLDTAAWLLLFAVLVRVVLSWVAPNSHHPMARVIGGLSDPVMAPFQRILPSFGGLDFSPILALMCLRLIQGVALSPLAEFGARML